MSVLTIEKDEQLDDLNSGTVVVDFYADWCGPCKMIAPIFEDVSQLPQFENITFIKLNVDVYKEIVTKFGIRGIPTLLVLKDGNVVGTKVGAVSKVGLIQFIEQAI